MRFVGKTLLGLLYCLVIVSNVNADITLPELAINWKVMKESCKEPRALNKYKFSSKSCILLGLYQLDIDSYDLDKGRKRVELYQDIVYSDIRNLKFKDANAFYTELRNLSKGLVISELSDYESSTQICKDTGMLYLNIFNRYKKHLIKKEIFDYIEDNIEAACKLQIPGPFPIELLK